jgi:hypothetical protein
MLHVSTVSCVEKLFEVPKIGREHSYENLITFPMILSLSPSQIVRA